MLNAVRFMLFASALVAVSASSTEQAGAEASKPAELPTLAARYQIGAGKLAEARASMAIAFAQEERAHGSDSLQTATALSRLALLHAAQGNAPKALTLYEHALRIRERRLGPSHLGVAKSLENLARMHLAHGTWCCDPTAPQIPHFSIARKLLKRALHIRERVLGSYHPDIADEAYNLATYAGWSPKVSKQPLYEKAFAVREKAFGPNSAPAAESLLKLADLAQSRHSSKPSNPSMARQRTEWCQDTRKIVALRRRALAIEEQALGTDALELKKVLSDLSEDACTEIGEADERLALRKRIVAIDEKAFGPESTEVAFDLWWLSLLLEAPEQEAEKKAVELRINRIRELHLSHDRHCISHKPPIWRPLVAMFDAQADLGKIENVDDFILNIASDHQDLPACLRGNHDAGLIAERYEKLGDVVSAERIIRGYSSIGGLAVFFAAHGREGEAAPAYRQALAQLEKDELGRSILNKMSVGGRQYYYRLIDGYVGVLRKQGATQEAETILKNALVLEEAAEESNTSNLVGRLDALGDLYAFERRVADAAAFYQQALQLVEKARGYGPKVRGGDLSVLAQIDKLIGFDVATARFEEADALYRRSLTIEQPDYATIRLKGREPYATIYVAGPRKPAIIKRLERYAAFRRTQGDLQGADILHKRALAIWAIELEQDVINTASPLTREGADDWYDIKRWGILVPIYHELGDQSAEQRTAKLLAAANTRQDRANNIPPRGSGCRPTTLPD